MIADLWEKKTPLKWKTVSLTLAIFLGPKINKRILKVKKNIQIQKDLLKFIFQAICWMQYRKVSGTEHCTLKGLKL